jgi:hypothetical protein
MAGAPKKRTKLSPKSKSMVVGRDPWNNASNRT